MAVDPVNGSGLFQYLEAFYENGIAYTVFAVAETPDILTNSGYALLADGVIANLKGREDEFDAVVFACGDAMPKFAENSDAAHNQDLISVVKAFGEKGKIMIGHCVAGLVFEWAGITAGKRLAVHPYITDRIAEGIATGAPFETDGQFFTARTENTLGALLPSVVTVLKDN